MMVSDAIKTQKIILLQDLIMKVYRGEKVKLPKNPTLFIEKDELKNKDDLSEKLIYFYFAKNKNIELSAKSYMSKDLEPIDLLALAVYRKYYPHSPTLSYLIQLHPELTNEDNWFE